MKDFGEIFCLMQNRKGKVGQDYFCQAFILNRNKLLFFIPLRKGEGELEGISVNSGIVIFSSLTSC